MCLLVSFLLFTISFQRGARSAMVYVAENGHRDPSSILDKAVYISHSTNNLGKCMNPTILFQAMGK